MVTVAGGDACTPLRARLNSAVQHVLVAQDHDRRSVGDHALDADASPASGCAGRRARRARSRRGR
jgi:hypothetical protein